MTTVRHAAHGSKLSILWLGTALRQSAYLRGFARGSPCKSTIAYMTEITTSQRRTLRAAAHSLKPVVSISQKGLTESVLKEIDRCLKSHELIKVRIYDAEREEREALLEAVCTQMEAVAVQHIGNLLVLWRQRAEGPEVAGSQKPGARKATGPRPTKKAAAAKTDKAARARSISQGKPRRPTRTR